VPPPKRVLDIVPHCDNVVIDYYMAVVNGKTKNSKQKGSVARADLVWKY